ncbi:MAG: hypothetical protein ACRETA_14325, partial [Gammaproteobacteria bacterium]
MTCTPKTDRVSGLGALAVLVITLLAGTIGLAQGAREPWMNKSLSPDQRADLLLKQMTLGEKIQLAHG